MKASVAVLLVAACVWLGAACDPIPNVTFLDEDAGGVANGGDQSTIGDPVSPDASAATKDAGRDASADAAVTDASMCEADAGEMCCGTHVCVGCNNAGDCNKCNAACSTPSDVCCPVGKETHPFAVEKCAVPKTVERRKSARYDDTMSRDQLWAFRAAAWGSDADVGMFLAQSSPLASSDLIKWLGVLVEPASLADDAAHQRRMRVFALAAEHVTDQAMFLPLVRALRTRDPRLRGLCAALLPRYNSVSGHTELCRVLGAEDTEVRAAAMSVLVQVAGKAAFDALMALVADPEFFGRTEALDLMASKAKHQVAPLAARVVEVGRPRDRMHALRIVMEMPEFAQHPTLATDVAALSLGDTDPKILAVALKIIAKYGSEERLHALAGKLLDSPEPLHTAAFIDALKAFPTPRTIAIYGVRLRQGTNPVRLAVIEASEAIGTNASLPLLVEALTQENVVVRTAALNAIGRLSDARKVDPARAILWLLRSREVNVRRMAIEVLNRVGDPRGELGPRLLKYLRDDDWWVRERTMDALIEIAGANLTRHLIPYLADPSAVVRRFAVSALSRIGDRATLGPLMKAAAEDDDWWVREDALAAVAKLGDTRAVPAILQLAKHRPDMRRACVEALRDLGGAEGLQLIAELVIDEDPDVRQAAILALGKKGGAAYAPVIEQCFEDPVPHVRKAARELLASWDRHTGNTTIQTQVALEQLLAAVMESDADDLLLFAGRPPYLKRRGQVEVLHGFKPLDAERLRSLLMPLLSPMQRTSFEDGKDIDFSHEMRAFGVRFRVNLFAQSTGIAAVFRIVKNDALLIVLENLGLPETVGSAASLKDGLVIVGGPTGAGKSTTLAALVDRINRTSARHIVTIEDPIETIHIGERSMFTQREVGSHTPTFAAALRAALRQDPDVILLGEMRDPTTFQFAVSAAETGHLVLATMHTPTVETSITRMIHGFPPAQQPQVRAMLAASLRMVVCQHLLRRKNGEGRVVAAEVMVMNEAISSLIRKGKEFQVATAIATGKAQGMQLMDQELARLVREGIIEFDDAYARATDKGAFLAASGHAAEGANERPSLMPGAPGRSVPPPNIKTNQGMSAPVQSNRPPPMSGSPQQRPSAAPPQRSSVLPPGQGKRVPGT
jgi:twitching motility protein PilT